MSNVINEVNLIIYILILYLAISLNSATNTNVNGSTVFQQMTNFFDIFDLTNHFVDVPIKVDKHTSVDNVHAHYCTVSSLNYNTSRASMLIFNVVYNFSNFQIFSIIIHFIGHVITVNNRFY